jgi:hypothetical protein
MAASDQVQLQAYLEKYTDKQLNAAILREGELGSGVIWCM